MTGMQSLSDESGNGVNTPTRTPSDESSPSNKVLPGLSNGESLRFGTGTLSAPPPPGFGEWPEERTRRANQLLFSVPDDGPVVANEDVASSGWYKQPNQNTTSFSNLVAVLGSGLAESMDDSTTYRMNSVDDDLGLSLARQSRHAASRLIGTGTSPNRNVGSGVVPRGPPPTSLGARPLRRSSTPEPVFSSYTPSAFEEIHEESAHGPQVIQRPFSVEADLHRQSTPLSIFAHGGGNSRAPPTSDIGLTVMEPGPFERNSAPPNMFEGILSGSQPSNSATRAEQIQELERDVQALSLDTSQRSQYSTSPTDISSQHYRSEMELHPFIWDVRGTEPSRALVILRASGLHIPDVRSTCEAFGVLETFRSDFSGRGVIFVGYYDIRSAQYAALELEACLKRLAMSERGDKDVKVQYCVPLNSSSAHDESIIVISDVPPGTSEDSLVSILSSYGSIRSIHRQGESQYDPATFVVEFHNVQDAKQALMELESTQPWGENVVVEEGLRNPAKRKRGRELLGLIGRWRQGNTQGSKVTPPISVSSSGSPVTIGTGPTHVQRRKSPTPVPVGSSGSSSPMVSAPQETAGLYAHTVAPGVVRHEYNELSPSRRHQQQQQQQQQSSQLLVAPDGSYSYVMVNHAAYPPSPHHQDPRGLNMVQPAPPPHQHLVHSHHGSYLASIPSSGSSHRSSPTSAPSHPHPVHYWPHAAPPTLSRHQYSPQILGTSPPQYGDAPPYYHGGNVPYYQQVTHTHPDSSISSGSGSAMQQQHLMANPPPQSPHYRAPPPLANQHQVEDREARHLMLDIDSVESGRDTRTSLMVRNIPNKYTQQMLLAEFTENGHGPGKIDFFYLPIDFKNRCNRGYAFVNFVDYRDIVPFHRQYFGQHWKVFNSDKICDVTYARIQGKAGMLKRFENSALMEKEDEYKPLVFVSHGAEKGRRIPFP
jgi:RNA recognition motif-containing protein